jgi:transcriptional regulator with XRE-family HTH domain
MKEMSDSLNISVAYLSAVETGKRNIPKSWKDKIIEIYDLNFTQQEEFIKAIENSLSEISLNLKGASDNKRNAALIFARKLEELNDDEVIKLISDLNKKGDN